MTKPTMTLIEVMTRGKGASIEADYELLKSLTDEKKLIVSYLTIFQYKVSDINDVTKELNRKRTTKFAPAFRAALIAGELTEVKEVEAYIRASIDAGEEGAATQNVLNKKAYFEKDLTLSLAVRKDERAKVLKELGLNPDGTKVK